MITLYLWIMWVAVVGSLIATGITFADWRDKRKDNRGNGWGSRHIRAKAANRFRVSVYFLAASFVWPIIIFWAIYKAFSPSVGWVQRIGSEYRSDLKGDEEYV